MKIIYTLVGYPGLQLNHIKFDALFTRYGVHNKSEDIFKINCLSEQREQVTQLGVWVGTTERSLIDKL